MTGTAEAIVVENWARRVREAMLVKSPGRLCLWVIPMKPLDVLRWISAVDNSRIRRISSLRVSVFCVYMPHRELLSPSRKAPRSLEWNDFLAPSGLHFETNRVDSVAATIKLFGFINFLYEATVHSNSFAALLRSIQPPILSQQPRHHAANTRHVQVHPGQIDQIVGKRSKHH